MAPNLNRIQSLTLGTLLFTIINLVWIYLYAAMNITFVDVFDFGIINRFLQPGFVIHTFVIGLFIALAIIVLVRFFHGLEKNDRIVMATVGGTASMFIGTIFYVNVPIYLFVMAFYLAGCVLLAFAEREDTRNKMSKLKAGWAYSNHIVFLLGVGAFCAGMLFTFADLPTYQQKTKDIIYDMVTDMVPGITSSMGALANMSRAEFDIWAIDAFNQFYADRGVAFDDLNASQQHQFLDERWDEYQAGISSRIETAATGMITPQLMNQVLEGVPIVRMMFDLLPIFTGTVLFSVVTLFGSICVRPSSAVLGLLLQTWQSQDSKEVRRLKNELAKKEREITALRKKE